MKKLMFATALAVSAAAFANAPTALNATSFEGYSGTSVISDKGDVGESGASGNYFCFTDGDADGSLIKTFGGDNLTAPITRPYYYQGVTPNANYLELNTEGGILWRSINTIQGAANAYTLGDEEPVAATGTYLDTLVQFTPTEDGGAPTLDPADKLAIWLNVDQTTGATNLMVRAKFWSGTPPAGVATNFVVNNVSVQAGAWYRLTVKAISHTVIPDTNYFIPAFQIFIDSTAVSASEPQFSADLQTMLSSGEGYWAEGMAALASENKLFPTLAAEPSTLSAVTLQGVGFKGSGAIDDLVWTEEYPFQNAAISFTLTWPAGLTPVSYQIGNGEPVAISGTSPFAVPGLAAGDVVKFIVANADGAQKTLTGTAGTDIGLDATNETFGWPEYLGEAVTGAYEIDDLAELILFQKGVAAGLTTASTTFKLTDDVTLTAPWPGVGLQNSKDLWSPASGTPAADVDIATNNYINGAFKGTFDGQNHTISGFQMQGGGLDYCGFFNSIYGATICNLKIAYAAALFAPDTTGSSAESGGTFVGVTGANSTLRNLTTAAGTVSCSKGFGGIVGYLSDGSLVEYCTNNVNLTSLKPNKCGGIAMIVQRGAAVTVRNCQNNGTIAGSNETGSLIGYIGLNVTIADCESTVAYKLMHHQGSTVTVQGTIKGDATVDSYTGQATPGLNFATVDGSVATFVADEALAAGNTYKVMHTATATYEFAAAGSISFDTNLIQTVTFAITAAEGLDAPTETTENGVVTFTVAGGAEFADDGAEDLLDENTEVTAGDVAEYVADITSEAAPTTVTKPMVLSYLLKANKILTTPETDVLKITAIEQVTGGWKITVAAALNAADVTAGATVDMADITGDLKVVATADLGTAFAPVAANAFTVTAGENGAAVITVTDANAKFMKAMVTK